MQCCGSGNLNLADMCSLDCVKLTDPSLRLIRKKKSGLRGPRIQPSLSEKGPEGSCLHISLKAGPASWFAFVKIFIWDYDYSMKPWKKKAMFTSSARITEEKTKQIFESLNSQVHCHQNKLLFLFFPDKL